ncbi:pyridoxamine 5'-phosphate oxidase [Streptomyces sp. NPDC048193]|uniref:pyridoxamine 5'-phosphate oxidase family protein n=1 Tax=unclassified Streptomyces TaxID=2593676 RepID=UPI003424C524
MTEPARPTAQRRTDALTRLEKDKDLWVATAGGGVPTLVPLSFWWREPTLYVATVRTNPTAVNIMRSGRVRLVLGHTRDVVLIDATGELVENADLPDEHAEAYAAKCGWDPRESRNYRFFRLEPRDIECWRELNEHADRQVMRDGRWLA